jgi:homoserine O-acetyltransferase
LQKVSEVTEKTNGDMFDSSDSVRSAEPLRHAEVLELDEPLLLERGGRLERVQVAYETYGKLNEKKDNAVLICHALSGDSHVAMHDVDDLPGWWDIVVGPGKSVDTDRYFVICPNLLGGCRGTTGPDSANPATGQCYGPDFPTITIGDMIEVQRRLIDSLGIDHLLAVMGGSMGGHQAILWPMRYPGRVRGSVLLATSARLSSQALAFDVVSRNAIIQDPNFFGGRYRQAGKVPDIGLAIARMIGHITYLSPEAMEKKFDATRFQPRDVPVRFEKEFSVGSYLGYQGARFVERFDANSYITISMAMDLFDLGATVEEWTAAFKGTDCRWMIISFSSDWLFSPRESQEMARALIAAGKPVSYCDVESHAGHDAFLLSENVGSYGRLIEGFLSNLVGSNAQAAAGIEHHHSQTSIFHPGRPQRLDVDRIVELIPPSSSVLDLGCGTGLLLESLVHRGNRNVMGVELDEGAVIDCVWRGLDVVRRDLNDGLALFADNEFDYVVLSQTLQSIMDVEGVIREMLRVGRRGIVSFPNFAYHKLRKMLWQGRAPEVRGLLRYKWYNSPNIRFLTITDFGEFCREKGIRIHSCAFLDTEEGRDIPPEEDSNLAADLAIFVLSRPET